MNNQPTNLGKKRITGPISRFDPDPLGGYALLAILGIPKDLRNHGEVLSLKLT